MPVPSSSPLSARPIAVPGTLSFTVLLGMIISLQVFGISVTLPALPAITDALGGGAEAAQLTISAYLAGVGAAQMVYGALSDRFGRRPVLLWGVALHALSGIGCALSQHIGVLIALRMVQGAGAAAGMVIARAMIRDLFEGAAAVRVLSIMSAIMSVVPLAAPLVGGWMLAAARHWAVFEPWRIVYATVAAGSLATFAGSAWLLRESLRHKDASATDPRRLLANCRRFVTTPGCVALGATMAFGSGAMFSYSATSSFVLIKVFGVASSTYGWFLTMTGAAMIAGSMISARLTGRWSQRRTLDVFTATLLLASLTVLAGSFSGLRGAPGIALLIGPMLVFGFSMGVIFVHALSAALQPVPQIAGVASALVGSMQMGAAALFVWLGGRLFDGTPTALGLCVALGSGISFMAYRLGGRAHTAGQRPAPPGRTR